MFSRVTRPGTFRNNEKRKNNYYSTCQTLEAQDIKYSLRMQRWVHTESHAGPKRRRMQRAVRESSRPRASARGHRVALHVLITTITVQPAYPLSCERHERSQVEPNPNEK